MIDNREFGESKVHDLKRDKMHTCESQKDDLLRILSQVILETNVLFKVFSIVYVIHPVSYPEKF